MLPEKSAGPDARISVTVETERHDLKSAFDKMNPLLQQIVKARDAAAASGGEETQVRPLLSFGRVHFSRSWSAP